MGFQIKPGFFADVREMPSPIVVKQNVAAANRGYEQVLIPVIVDVRKSGRHADAVWQADPGFLSDVLEVAPAQVLPQLIPTHLIHEVNVVEPVAIHVRDASSTA